MLRTFALKLMSPINSADLHAALCALQLPCLTPKSETIRDLRELSAELGHMFRDLPQEIVVPDPEGKRDLSFYFQPAGAFTKNLLLLHDSEILIFGHDAGGYVLFISGLQGGKVGLVWGYPDDVFEMDFTEDEAPVVFWNEEFLTWLQFLKIHGNGYLHEPGDDFG